MEMRQILYVLAIAEEGGVTKAAKRLFITQSALDQQLIKLENELGVQLFIRSRNSFLPTDAGQVYVDYARRIIDLKNEAYLRIHDIADQKRGTLRVAFAPERGMEMFTQVYPEFYKSYPNVTVVPREVGVKKQIEMLQKDEIDLAFISIQRQSIPGIVSTPLASEEFVLVTPQNHPLASRMATRRHAPVILPMEELRYLTYCLMYRESTQREVLDPMFKKADIKPDIFLETASNRANISMVEKGLCCSIVPNFYVKESSHLPYFQLENHPGWVIAACHRNNRYQSKAAQCFIQLAKKYFQ